MNIYDMGGAIVSPDWEYQICKYCGREQRFDYQVVNYVWRLVAGKDYQDRVLCFECFLKLADTKGIKISKHDITFICVISKSGWSWTYN